MRIEPFDKDDALIRSNVEYIMTSKPVKNLTEDEVLTTLRLLQLHCQLRGSWGDVCVSRYDNRLERVDDKDRFLALLIDCNQRGILLDTKTCMRKFGGTVYHWRKIARECAITYVASALSESGNGGYYGRGWCIAIHIVTLIRWIINKADNEEIKKLKGLY